MYKRQSENFLNPMAFKSLKKMESEVVRMSAAMLNGDDQVVGTMTSGGTDTDTGSESEANSRLNEQYTKIWDAQIRPQEKRWAHRTSDCESGSNPRAIGGGGAYRGAFQFMRSTWKAAPRSPGGDPIAYPYRTQAVVAVLLKRRDGAGHWPVCGR